MKHDTSTDVLGIGFGPSNLAFAVAYEEDPKVNQQLNVTFAEREDGIRWHGDMLIPWTLSQVSCLKDLVTLRNPRSKFTFLNFLKSVNRLDEFINLGTFTPYRTEISKYFSWVGENLELSRCLFNHECDRIMPVVEDGRVVRWSAHFRNGHVISTRDIVFSTGRDLHIPDVFAHLTSDRIFHSEHYLSRIRNFSNQRGLRVGVIGSAQSSAEVFRAVHDDLPDCRPAIIFRKAGFRYYDTNPFLNELFYPSAVDDFYALDKEGRKSILDQMHYTNYGGVAPYLLDELYQLIYRQRLHGEQTSQIVPSTEVVEAREEAEEIHLTLRNTLTGKITRQTFDVVILGTGFENKLPRLLDNLVEYLEPTEEGGVNVSRRYRVQTAPHVDAGLYLQGLAEDTHGITDSLLSILASRSQFILDDICERRLSNWNVDHLNPEASVGRTA